METERLQAREDGSLSKSKLDRLKKRKRPEDVVSETLFRADDDTRFRLGTIRSEISDVTAHMFPFKEQKLGTSTLRAVNEQGILVGGKQTQFLGPMSNPFKVEKQISSLEKKIDHW